MPEASEEKDIAHLVSDLVSDLVDVLGERFEVGRVFWGVEFGKTKARRPRNTSSE